MDGREKSLRVCLEVKSQVQTDSRELRRQSLQVGPMCCWHEKNKMATTTKALETERLEAHKEAILAG